MSTDIDTIHKALRNVPDFDGNPNVLIRFINICDQLVTSYVNPAPGHELTNVYLINGILNKIIGNAARILNTNGTPTSWEGIRNALKNNFSDQRDESALYTDLSMLTQGSDSPQIFYERVLNLLSTIMTYVQLHDSVSTTVEAKRSLYNKLALQSYLRGLNEPLGKRIRCMRPSSLEDSLKFAQEELNVIYLQNKTRSIPNRNSTPFTTPAHVPMHAAHVPNVPFSQNSYLRQVSQPMYGNISQNVSQATPRQQYFPNPGLAGPSRTQQIFRALPKSNMSTGFKIPPKPQNFHQNFNRNNFSQPMSGISHPVARTLPPMRRDSQTHVNAFSNYKPREVNFNESYDFDPYVQSYESSVFEYDAPTPYITYQAEHLASHPNEYPFQQDHSYELTNQDFPADTQASVYPESNFSSVPKDNSPE